ncbi:RES domain-containing protein (plasmid) [Rhizobium ruizarguesonis]|uniref:RES family NAD+ phosphorylase n=1 Tax=Rhizobium ruizarguesonis TaxID=2081791 RepID=UPI00102F7E33|nr:RES family NAD+ phosphorylase [Rhizobium ruizarguesonis]MBY5886711.1 RES family NAD+ phosphorylase [Rhizobium leguminosarum]TBY87229.1 RES domain-containing protein [Rhizobium leguminosarum bv. viciae]NEJ14871.1 RES domain-containing protein [Rhizobium ruizarguesonis]NEK28946.1 RES domain-containing protein [Rhizobium ruizarguesonis]QSZ03711.1 RES domain-containing protein [Rhizobium ruizarguesonis]
MPANAGRGPSGSALPPPPWLAHSSLPIDLIAAGQVLHRVHRTPLDPIFFGPGPGIAATNRFDSASGRFGILYVGMSRRGAIAETILRNPQRLMVSMTEITTRAISELSCIRPLRIVRMHGTGLQALGTDDAVSTGPYEPCGLWADALWDHADQPDGLAYQSRHDSSEICLALFERSDMAFDRKGMLPLSGILKEIAAILEVYGKSLSPVGPV